MDSLARYDTLGEEMAGYMANSRQDVERRLIDAAADLMQGKAPSAVTGRELAQRAGVNYGMIHHYFGGKDDVFRIAMREVATAFAEEALAAGPESPISIASISAHQRLWRVIAQFALDEEFRAGTAWSYPVLRARVAQLADGSPSAEEDARFRASVELIFAFGWVVFKPLVRDAYDLDEDEMGEMARRVDVFLREL